MAIFEELDYAEAVVKVMNMVMFTEEGVKWCNDYGVTIEGQGMTFSLEYEEEPPVKFDWAIFVDNLMQNYDDERLAFLIDAIDYDEDMYSAFCAFQEIVFGTCWIF